MNTKIFAISDLHLSGAEEKTMDIFGAEWKNHWEKITTAWRERVGQEDLVLIPGDISWAMTLQNASVDLNAIGLLPGTKLLLKGNHDYWWSSVSRVREVLPQDMFVLQNDAFAWEDICVCGSRGWLCPNENGFSKEDEKIYLRELQRMELSLFHAKQKKPDGQIIVMMHFPPFNDKRQPSGFVQLFEKYEVKQVVYGHLHGPSLRYAFEGIIQNVNYRLVSSDYIHFVPIQIL